MKKSFLFKIFRKRKNKNLIQVDGNIVPSDDVGNPNYSFLIGKIGECVTDLKPIGKAKIEGNIYNVKSEKYYLYNGNRVRVVRTEGSTIYVEKIKLSDLK